MNPVEQQVRQWIERVVVGLNLCPFAGAPFRDGLVRIVVSPAVTRESLLAELQSELVLIDETPATTIETTLLVVTGMLADFGAYNDFLSDVEDLLRDGDWEGEYQVASFHPQYRFQRTKAGDAGNLTNRAPWPILHILREASIETALADYPQPESIPERNIQTMKSLSPEERRELFPWLG